MITTNFLIQVFCAGVLGYIVGALWFSPALFMKPWMHALGKTVQATGAQMSRVMAYGFLNTLAGAFAVGILIELSGVTTLTEYLAVTLFAVFAFIATTKFNDLIYASQEPHWSKKPQMLFLINVGYYVVSFSAMSIVFWFMR